MSGLDGRGPAHYSGNFMFGAIAKALFGSQNDRILKGLQKPVAAVNALASRKE